MPLVAIKCPSCGGDLELDNEREFGFCIFCGTKVLIQQTQKVNVTGHVTIDNSKNIDQFRLLSHNAFQSKRYGDAYRYYAQLLDCGEETPEILFNRSICAIHLSSATELNVSEFSAGLAAIRKDLISRTYTDNEDLEKCCKAYLSLAVEALSVYIGKCNKCASDSEKFDVIRSSLYEVACVFAEAVSTFPHPEGCPYIYYIYFSVSELFDHAANFGGKNCTSQQEQIVVEIYQHAITSCTAITSELVQYRKSVENIPVVKEKVESHVLNRSIFAFFLVLSFFTWVSIVIDSFSIGILIIFAIGALLAASAISNLPAGKKWTCMIERAELQKEEMWNQLINRIKSLK